MIANDLNLFSEWIMLYEKGQLLGVKRDVSDCFQ